MDSKFKGDLMFALIDQFFIGTLDSDKINFNRSHFRDQLDLNRLDFDYVKSQIINEEPIHYKRSKKHDNRYECFYPAPSHKNYKYFKVIIEDCINHIAVVSIMDDGKTSPKGKRNATKSKRMLQEETLRRKAVMKRKNF